MSLLALAEAARQLVSLFQQAAVETTFRFDPATSKCFVNPFVAVWQGETWGLLIVG